MRGLLVGRNTIATGLAVTAAAGLIASAAPPPAHSTVVVSHREVALTAAPSISSADLNIRVVDVVAGTSALVVAAFVGGPVLLVAGGVTLVANGLGLLDKPIDAASDWLMDNVRKHFPIDRFIDALPRELKAEGEVIARLLVASRLANLKNLDITLSKLQDLLDQRQKFTDKELGKAKVNLTAALSVVGGLVGYPVPATQVSSWFDQADARIDRAYDGLDGRLQKLQEQIDKLIASPSAATKPSARVATSKAAGSRKSTAVPTKPSTGARSARQAGKPAAASNTGKATKSTPTHARSARAAK